MPSSTVSARGDHGIAPGSFRSNYEAALPLQVVGIHGIIHCRREGSGSTTGSVTSPDVSRCCCAAQVCHKGSAARQAAHGVAAENVRLYDVTFTDLHCPTCHSCRPDG